MVNVNFWFTPRSRSTALLRCLSNIPDSKIIFEKFTWLCVSEAAPETFDLFGVGNDPTFTYENILEEWRAEPSKFKILKELNVAVKDETLPEIADKDSVNIFLVRSPALTATSNMPSADITYYDVISESEALDMPMVYQKMLDAIEFVKKNCEKPPLILPGKALSTKEGSVKVVKQICELMGAEFSEDMLSWKSYETFDPSWDVSFLSRAADIPFGFFSRANQSTGFEDGKEREVDMKKVAEDNPQMAADIEKTDPIYEQIMEHAEKFD